MRSILIFADRRPGTDARLDCALSLARSTNGHITALIDTPVARYFSLDPMGGSYIASDALKQALTEDDAYAAEIDARLGREAIPFDLIRSEADPVEALARAARLADVVIVPRSSGLTGELALVSRAPVMALPDDTDLRFPVANVCIAWDGGDEASHALRSATPLLAGCGAVQVISVAEKAGGFPPTEALRYLFRHGIKAELVEITRQGSTEETIARAVEQAGAHLLVMGAFGKSRIREYLFGGVTRYFLEERAGPALLLAH